MRWLHVALVMAAVHRWSGWAIIAAVVATLALTWLRDRLWKNWRSV